MKTILKKYLTWLMVLFLAISCQDNQSDINPPSEDDAIEVNSDLALSMMATAANDGSADDFLDGSSCIELNLPVTIQMEGIAVTIETMEDLLYIENFIIENNIELDNVELQYPITITFSDYTQVIINNESELNVFIEECTPETEPISCVDFVYPITFSLYDVDFQIIETVEIESEIELYEFFDGLQAGTDQVTLVSLNFPVSLEYASGAVIEVNNNQELQDAINDAENNCEPIDECTEEQVLPELTECLWAINSLGGDTDTYADYSLNFHEDGSGQILNDYTVFYDFNWETSVTDEGIVISITENTSIGPEIFYGDWLITNCTEGGLVLESLGASGTSAIELVLEQDCSNSCSELSLEDDLIVHMPFSGNLENLIDNVDGSIQSDDTEFIIDRFGNPNCAVNFINEDAQIQFDLLPGNGITTEDDFTISFWTKVSLEAEDFNFEQFILQMGMGDIRFSIRNWEGNNYYNFGLSSANTADSGLLPVDYDEQWHHFALTIKPQELSGENLVDIGIYMDGAQSYMGNGPNPISVSEMVDYVLGYYYVGGLDDLRVYKRALCEDEIQELYNYAEACDGVVDTCQNPSNNLANDLVMYMPFSNQAKDLISGYEPTTVINDFVDDRGGNSNCAIVFTYADGDDDLITIPSTVQNQLVQGDNFSVSLWFKMQNDIDDNLELFFQKGEVTNSGFQMGAYDLNKPLVSDTTNGYGLWDDSWDWDTWDNTDWHHLVVTRDADNTIRLYRDGQLRNIEENYDFDIGATPLDYYLGRWFQGFLDDLRVYKRTLSEDEVWQLYELDADCCDQEL